MLGAELWHGAKLWLTTRLTLLLRLRVVRRRSESWQWLRGWRLREARYPRYQLEAALLARNRLQLQSLILLLLLMHVSFVKIGFCIVMMMSVSLVYRWPGLVSTIGSGRAEPWWRKVVALALGAL